MSRSTRRSKRDQGSQESWWLFDIVKRIPLSLRMAAGALALAPSAAATRDFVFSEGPGIGEPNAL